jgi:DNA-directed RNA polymerase
LKKEFVNIYKNRVFTLLEKNRYLKHDSETLLDIQNKIEDLTLNFSEDSIFKACPNIMRMLTVTTLPSAKEYLRGRYVMDKENPGRMKIYEESGRDSSLETGASELNAKEKKNLRNILSDSDKLLLVELGEHSIECLLVHTLGHLFNIESIVSVASLVDHIERNVRHYASTLCNKRDSKQANDEGTMQANDEGTKAAKTRPYPFGTALVEFLVSRGLLRLETLNNDILNKSDESGPKTVVKNVVKKGNNYYRSSFVYAQCMFNPQLLPIKLNLPMVFPPKDWEPHKPEQNRQWLNISDIYGGYLSNPTGQIYSTQRSMSTPDAKNFFIYFGKNNEGNSHIKLNRFCTSISSLQRQAFKINTVFLNCILEHRDLFEDSGYLMPEFLSKVILHNASGILRSHFDKNKDIQTIYKFSEVYALLIKNMQQARYECTILDLAKAYSGYSIYFPAFIDFRGRIYRSGIFHFHERDLARSLLLLDCKENMYESYKDADILSIIYLTATAFHYQSYKTIEDAITDIKKMSPNIEYDGINRMSLKSALIKSQIAKRPFQFLSNILQFIVNGKDIPYTELLNSVPVTQDASASAYQLMAYFLLDRTFAIQTNLIDTGSDEIFDIYSHMRIELIDFLKASLSVENPELCAILDRVLTRSVVKKIYMPIIYGKTANSTTKDLIECLSQDVLPKECSKLAVLCFKFWKTKYSYMDAFIQLISLVGRVCSSLERPVLYSAEYFSTSQDYKKMEKHSVRVFDSYSKKARNVTLTFPSNERDKRKSRVSTFVNFIHQKDAQIAMSIAFHANERNPKIPLYTVHDNFITNTHNCMKIPNIYLNVIQTMGPPLRIINRFIYINIIEPAIANGLYNNVKGYNMESFDNMIIPDKILDEFLKIGGIPPSEVRNAAGWKKITEQLKQRYQLYCNAVCDNKDNKKGENKKTFKSHLSNWNRFRDSLNGNYCIHY